LKEIEFFIDRHGNVKIDVKTGEGPSCLKETEDLEKKLGEVISKEKKPSFYSTSSIDSQKIQYTK